MSDAEIAAIDRIVDTFQAGHQGVARAAIYAYCARVNADRPLAVDQAARNLLAAIGPTDDDVPARLRPFTLALRTACAAK